MKSCMPEAFTRDLAGRMVLGAFNALSTERHIDCTHRGAGAGTRTHFLEVSPFLPPGSPFCKDLRG